MTSISTDGHAGSQAQSSLLRKGSDQVFTVAFLITTVVATVGWLCVLTEAAMAVTNWLLF